MTLRPQSVTLRLAGALLVLGLSACGSASGGSGASGTASSAAGSGGAGTAGASSAGSASAQAAATADPARFCAVVAKQRSQLAGTQLSGLLAGGSPAAWKAYLARTSQLNAELEAAAPPEIRPSVETLKASDDELASALAAADYQPQKVGSAKLIAIISTPQRRAASVKLTAYTKATCGIDLASPPAS